MMMQNEVVVQVCPALVDRAFSGSVCQCGVFLSRTALSVGQELLYMFNTETSDIDLSYSPSSFTYLFS